MKIHFLKLTFGCVTVLLHIWAGFRVRYLMEKRVDWTDDLLVNEWWCLPRDVMMRWVTNYSLSTDIAWDAEAPREPLSWPGNTSISSWKPDREGDLYILTCTTTVYRSKMLQSQSSDFPSQSEMKQLEVDLHLRPFPGNRQRLIDTVSDRSSSFTGMCAEGNSLLPCRRN